MRKAVELLKKNQLISLTREISLIAPPQVSRPDNLSILKGFRIERLSDSCFILVEDETKSVVWAEAYDVYNAYIHVYPKEVITYKYNFQLHTVD